ncbi:MAG: hypothetical protein RLZZ591_2160 [Pseudomonadota bacterium]|jgi:GGDEF domain-containing protein
MNIDNTRLLGRLRGWMDQLQELDSSASRLDRVGLVVTLVVVALSGLVMGVAGTAGLSRGINTFAAYIGALAYSVMLLIVWLRPHATQVIRMAASTIGALVMIRAAWDNGILPMAVWPAVIALLHVLLRPVPALVVSVAVVAASLIVLFNRDHVVDPALLLRLVLASVVSILLWQLTIRFWRRQTLHMRSIGTDMSVALAQLDAERLDAQQRADRALTTDMPSGLLNRRGFIADLELALTAAPSADGVPAGRVVALRLSAWNEATVHRDPATQMQLLRALLARMRSLQWPGALLARSASDSYLVWLPTGSALLVADEEVDAVAQFARRRR